MNSSLICKVIDEILLPDPNAFSELKIVFICER